MNKQPTLEQRIAVAVQPDTAITSADVAALIEEAEAGIAKADKQRTVEGTLSLDPKAARQAIADATFAANRLRTLLSKLQARYQQALDQEQETVWLARHDALKQERDALAEELREVYPAAMAKIVGLFTRIIANDEALSALHQARPAGMLEHLLSAELYARGLDSFSRDTPTLLTAVHLVDLDGREAWPPPQRSMAEAFAATYVPAYPRGSTADWAADHERRIAAHRAEQQRIADYYARATKEQEERQNAEAREVFMEQQRRNSRSTKP